MARDPRSTLPKRFRPFYDQAQTQSELRYGAQESALGSVLAQLVRDYGRQSQAQHSAGQSVLGALSGASAGLEKVYTDAGLTPALRAQISESPTGQRLAGELASGQASIQDQTRGAQMGQQYIQQRLGEQYQDDVGQVSDQSVAMAKERGLFTSSLLDQLISGDRASRSAANAAAREATRAEQQKALDRATQTGNALIGQGITPIIGDDGSVSLGNPLPGGKADPNAPANKPKGSKPNRATNTERSGFGTDFSRALGLAKNAIEKPEDRKSKALRSQTARNILDGFEASGGETIYDTNKKGKDGLPNPNYGKPLLNADGTEQKTEKFTAVEKVANQVAVQAALDIAFDGALSRETVRKLHDLGIKTTDLGNLPTQTQKARQRKSRDYARPGTAKTRDQQPG
jgi:hypothetical protein